MRWHSASASESSNSCSDSSGKLTEPGSDSETERVELIRFRAKPNKSLNNIGKQLQHKLTDWGKIKATCRGQTPAASMNAFLVRVTGVQGDQRGAYTPVNPGEVKAISERGVNSAVVPTLVNDLSSTNDLLTFDITQISRMLFDGAGQIVFEQGWRDDRVSPGFWRRAATQRAVPSRHSFPWQHPHSEHAREESVGAAGRRPDAAAQPQQPPGGQETLVPCALTGSSQFCIPAYGAVAEWGSTASNTLAPPTATSRAVATGPAGDAPDRDRWVALAMRIGKEPLKVWGTCHLYSSQNPHTTGFQFLADTGPDCRIFPRTLVAAPSASQVDHLVSKITETLQANGFKIASAKIKRRPCVTFLGVGIASSYVTPPEVKVSRDVKTLHDMQCLVESLQWLHNIVLIPPEVMDPLYDLLKGKHPWEPKELTPQATSSPDFIESQMSTGALARWNPAMPLDLHVHFTPRRGGGSTGSRTF
ncbi:uncharacterized protein LOC141726923 isoform X1 [Zonotrichia albicollis]|uniref:uncharacterized protein LOC141726923 isoform X1 n=1 Tax=Zonotrichia albicollis TaxID=44394 RepID=UPI003D80B008